ncbi:MAG: hypothetical protein VX341_00055 [Bdellovibrionota bacterium]|nr:hypothetical protein [Bdellovibrionota bacterium]
MKKIILAVFLIMPSFAKVTMQQLTVNLRDTSTFKREMGSGDFIHSKSDMRVAVRAKQNEDGEQVEKTSVDHLPNYLQNEAILYNISVPSGKLTIIDQSNGQDIQAAAEADFIVADDFSKIDIRLDKDEILKAYGAEYEMRALQAASKFLGAVSLDQVSFKTRLSDLKCESDLATLVCQSGFTVVISVRE